MRRAFLLVVMASAAPLCLVHCVGDASIAPPSSVDGGSPGTDSGNAGNDGGTGAVDSGAGGNDAGTANDAGGGTDAGDAGPPPPKQAFGTSKAWDGQLGANAGVTGLAAGDARCMEAAAQPFPNRKFHAWLSTDTVAAKDHINSAGPWYVGATLLGDINTLTTSVSLKAVWLTETGQPLPSNSVWTGTLKSGAPNVGATCMNWTSKSANDNGSVGTAGGSDGFWTEGSQLTCDAMRGLYCLEE